MGDIARRASALLLAAAIVASGCSKVENASGPVSASKPGVVRIVGFNTLDSLVPELSTSIASVDVGQFWAAWLFLVNDKGTLEPDLATVVPTTSNGGISKNNLSITYHLRRGVTWQDGAPFSAADVIFSWHAIMNPANNIVTREGYDDIASMSAPDPYTVIVQLKRPYGPAVATFFGPSLQPMCILPAHLLAKLPNINRADYDNHPIGTGPFQVVDFEPGTKIELKPNPHYWRGAPKLSEVDFLMAGDPITQSVMIRTGEADLYYDPPTNLLSQLRASPGVHMGDLTFNEFWYITINEKHPPLDDVRVRRALAMLVDRNLLVGEVLHGGATPAYGDQPAFSWAYDAAARQPAYDPAGAGKLLDAAGWRRGPDGIREKNGKPLSLVLVTSNNWNDAKSYTQIYQREAAQEGVQISIKIFTTAMLEETAASGGILDTGKFDMGIEGWIAGVDPDDSALFMCDQIPPNGYNHSQACDPRIDAQERIALTNSDQSIRRAAYAKIQSYLAEDIPVVFLYFSKRDDAISNGLGNYRPSPSVTEFWNTWEWTMR